jgi:cysteine sulfinate desulfinase/cysteine desulfurase-like protein
MIYLNTNSKTIISKKTESEILRWETVLNNDIQKEKIDINSIIDKYKTYIYSQCNITKNKYDIIFTSGGSKSNNFILKLLSLVNTNTLNASKIIHIIISSIDDINIINYCKLLEKNKLITFSLVKPNEEGIITLEDIKKLINPKTVLINIPYSNGDLGSVNNIKDINDFCKSNKLMFFCNFDYLFGFNKINLNTINIDFISFSFDKIYGPHDIGLVLVKKGIITDEVDKIIKNSPCLKYFLINVNRSIPLLLGSLASLIDILKNRKEKNLQIMDLKTDFINKLHSLFPIVYYSDYVKMYNQSIIKLSIIILGSRITNNINKNTICLSIFSIKTKICINDIKKHLEEFDIIVSTLSNNVLNVLDIDNTVKRGIITISFNDNIKKSDIGKIFKYLIKSISLQYPDIYNEIKDTIVVNEKMSQKKPKKIVRFSTPLCRFTPEKKNINNKLIKSILIK